VARCTISIRPTYSLVHVLTYLFTYLLTQLARANKTGNISETVENKAIDTTAYIKSYAGFRLRPKCTTLNDLCTRFKVIDSSNAAKMVKYSLVMTPTSCRLAGCIISVRRM